VVSPCVAVSEHVPDDNMVTAIPDTEHTDVVVDVIEGVTPDDADVVTLNGVDDHVFVVGLVKEIVLAARAMVTACVADVINA
jgi:hypothetical protein